MSSAAAARLKKIGETKVMEWEVDTFLTLSADFASLVR
jgi:hypothetical protein